MGMLAPILDFLFPPKDTARIVARTNEIEFGRLLAPTVLASGAVGLLPYRHSLVRAAIIEAKFHRNPKALSLLATVLKDYLDAYALDVDAFEPVSVTLIPIPLSAQRRRERGYNQVEEIAKRGCISYDGKILARVRDTTQQTSLPRKARLENMTGAFAAVDSIESNRTYIILDDVHTTGATLESARAALIERGSTRVELLSLAH